MTNAPTPSTLELLYDGRIDFGVVSEPFQVKAGIKYMRVRKIRDIFVAGSKFDYLQEKDMEYKDLESLPIISLEDNTSTRKYVNEFLESNQVILNPEFELATSDMIVKFAMRNLGIGCVVKNFADEALDKGNLFELHFKSKIPERSICIVTSRHNPISEAGNKLLKMLNKVLD